MNNIEKIRSFINFDNPGEFYYLQILKRKKENPDMNKNNNVIKNFYVSNLEYFDHITPRVIKLCEDNNARAYIRLNKRSYEKVALENLKQIARLISEGNYLGVKSSYDAACGRVHVESPKLWIIDIDDTSALAYDIVRGVNNVIERLQEEITKSEYSVQMEIETPNGYHIITNPFNVQEFRKIYPRIDIHKDNPTVMYCPIQTKDNE